MKSVSEIYEAVAALPHRPEAVQALWDGDSGGWMLRVTAVFCRGRSYHTEYIATLRGDGGDIRIFNGLVSPWPEAQLAAAAGLLIETHLKIPFFFPSPEEPEDDCPDWWERERGKPCPDCNKILLQDPNTPWFGHCYPCHLKRERASRGNP
jgi:hypothetical protein